MAESQLDSLPIMSTKSEDILRCVAGLLLAIAGYVAVCLTYGLAPIGWLVLLVVVAGISLPFGLWFQARNRRKAIADHPRCAGCGYNLTGHQGAIGRPEVRCPECGGTLGETSVVREGQPHPDEIRRRWARVDLVLAMLGLLGISGSAILMIGLGMWGWKLWFAMAVEACMAVWFGLEYWRQKPVRR